MIGFGVVQDNKIITKDIRMVETVHRRVKDRGKQKKIQGLKTQSSAPILCLL